jgi:4-azaleucine resistance transporter AzlC
VFRQGVIGSLALLPSVFVYGTVWGALARQALALWEIVAMCLLVTAGASQFVAVPMIASGAPPLTIVLTTYVVNVRHYLMAAVLAPAFARFPRPWVALIAHGINDESFALATARQNPPDPWFYIGSAVAMYVAFITGAITGSVLGGLVDEPARYGLDFAFPAVFLALVATQLTRSADWLVAVAAAGLAVALAVIVPYNWHILIAGLTVSGLGALLLSPDMVATTRQSATEPRC